MDERREPIGPVDEALLATLLMSRLERGIVHGGRVTDVEASLRQAGAAYRERVQPLHVSELKAAVERLRIRVPDPEPVTA